MYLFFCVKDTNEEKCRKYRYYVNKRGIDIVFIEA